MSSIVLLIHRFPFPRGYLTEKYNWGYHYYFLADEGVQFLRDYLHLDAEALPDTHTARTAKDAEEEQEAEKPEGRKWNRE